MKKKLNLWMIFPCGGLAGVINSGVLWVAIWAFFLDNITTLEIFEPYYLFSIYLLLVPPLLLVLVLFLRYRLKQTGERTTYGRSLLFLLGSIVVHGLVLLGGGTLLYGIPPGPEDVAGMVIMATISGMLALGAAWFFRSARTLSVGDLDAVLDSPLPQNNESV